MKKVPVLLAIIGLLLIIGWGLNDYQDEETALFRAVAPTEEVLAARESFVQPERSTKQLLLGFILIIPYFVSRAYLLGRKK